MKLLDLCTVAISLAYSVAPVVAHGYVSEPRSRQALCRDGVISPNLCGGVQYEPQSVEGLHGSFLCNGNGARFSELNIDANFVGKAHYVEPGIDKLTFVWTLPARHSTSTWEYFVLTKDNTLLTSIDSGGAVPPPVVEQVVPLRGLTGPHTILARWNIADTQNSFYSCVDLVIAPYSTETAVASAAPTAHAVQLTVTLPDAEQSNSTGPEVDSHSVALPYLYVVPGSSV